MHRKRGFNEIPFQYSITWRTRQRSNQRRCAPLPACATIACNTRNLLKAATNCCLLSCKSEWALHLLPRTKLRLCYLPHATRRPTTPIFQHMSIMHATSALKTATHHRYLQLVGGSSQHVAPRAPISGPALWCMWHRLFVVYFVMVNLFVHNF